MKSVALSGRPLEEITVEAATRGELTADDVRIHSDTLRHQADIAVGHGNAQLGANLRRASELTAVDDEEVLAIYEALRPRRSSLADLEAIAARLHDRGATACASLVREAALVYARRGLLRPS